jgi:hypothetical protein
MMAPRISPFEPIWRERAASVRRHFDMEVPRRLVGEEEERARLARVAIVDASAVPRTLVKGKGSADVLARSGWSVPATFFEPVLCDQWSFVARTGTAEYWVEGGRGLFAHREKTGGTVVLYPRQEGSLLLRGPMVKSLLSEAASIPIDLSSATLHLTMLMRVSCALLPRPGLAEAAVQVWVDPTYALYLGEELESLAKELGGGMVGHDIGNADGLMLIDNEHPEVNS